MASSSTTIGARTRTCLLANGFQVIENVGQGDCFVDALIDVIHILREKGETFDNLNHISPDLPRESTRNLLRIRLVNHLDNLVRTPGNPFGDLQYDGNTNKQVLLEMIGVETDGHPVIVIIAADAGGTVMALPTHLLLLARLSPVGITLTPRSVSAIHVSEEL